MYLYILLCAPQMSSLLLRIYSSSLRLQGIVAPIIGVITDAHRYQITSPAGVGRKQFPQKLKLPVMIILESDTWCQLIILESDTWCQFAKVDYSIPPLVASECQSLLSRELVGTGSNLRPWAEGGLQKLVPTPRCEGAVL